MKTKTCVKCTQSKPSDQFYDQKGSKDGLTSSCKECKRKQSSEWKRNNPEKVKVMRDRYNPVKRHKAREYREKNLEKVRGYQRQWQENNRDKISKNVSNYLVKNPEKQKAHLKVLNAVRYGKLPKASTLQCDMCSGSAEQYHHEDYSKPLDVIPLCRFCHGEIHRLDNS